MNDLSRSSFFDLSIYLSIYLTWNWLESDQISPFLENVKQATAWQANRNNQTRSRRQKDCVVNEVQHAKWISELG